MKGRSRIAFRIFLVVALFAAALNTAYVYKFTDPEAVAPVSALPGYPLTGTAATIKSVAEEQRPAPPRTRYPTDSWHGNVEVRQQGDGSYSFVVKTGSEDGAINLTSYEAWIAKAGSSEEKKVELKKDPKSGLVAKVQFPEKGNWMLRVRVASGNNSLEFSQRVEVK